MEWSVSASEAISIPSLIHSTGQGFPVLDLPLQRTNLYENSNIYWGWICLDGLEYVHVPFGIP